MIELAIINILTVIVVFIFMEGVAWFLHKYVMHGFGWYLHEDHHRSSEGKFEKNDVFGLFFSIVAFLFILFGSLSGFDIKFYIGIGITLYGFGYLFVHDIFFHRRIKIKFRPKSKYIKRVLHAHTIHHQKSSAKKGVCFGFLYATRKYSVDN
jgi:beta-carotene 3-hydroxylase